MTTKRIWNEKMNSMTRGLWALLLLVAVFSTGVASAADVYWTNTNVTIAWTNAPSWSSTAVPLTGDRAIFGLTNLATITTGGTSGGGWSIADVLVTNRIGSAGGTLTFLFNTANKTSSVYNSFIIGDSGVAGQAEVRTSVAGTQVLAVTNNGAGQLIVGAGGNGTLSVARGSAGQVMVVWADQIILGRDNGVTGTVVMAASGASANTELRASNMVVGASGVGIITTLMTNLISGQLVLGQNNTGVGSFTLNNAIALLAVTNSGGNANLIVGQNGAGNLTLTAGKLIADNLLIATNTGSRGTFTWTAGAELTVNNSSDAMAIFTNFINPNLSGPTQWGSNSLQALIFNTNVVGTANFYNGWVLGASAGGTGVVSLGQASAAGIANYYVTNSSGSAQLVVGQNGGGNLTLNAGNLFVNQLLVTNNTLTVTNSLFTFGGGTLTTSNAADAVATRIIIASNATFAINGTWNMLGGTNIVRGLSTNNTTAGTVAIGNGVSNALVTVTPGVVWNLNDNTGTYSNLNLYVGSGAAGSNNTLTVNNGIVTNVQKLTVGDNGADGNRLILSNGANVYFSGAGGANGGFSVGSANGTGNVVTVGGLGNASTLTGVSGGFTVGAGNAGGGNNTLTITNGAVWYLGSGTTQFGGGVSSNNTVNILSGGTLSLSWNIVGVNGTIHINNGLWTNAGSVAFGGIGNTLVVSNGGQVAGTSISISGSNNFVNIGGYGLMSTGTVSGAVNVGTTTGAGYNQLTVTNALFSSVGAIIGFGTSNNTATVQAGGVWNLGAGTLTVGTNAAIGNVLWVQSGGILDANRLITGAGAGNRITNSGGVFQFTTNAPTVTIGAGVGSIAISDGTISFRNLTNTVVNLTNNWGNSQLANMGWSGNNALRLNNSIATNSLAGGYTFQTGNPTNYYRLEMINGTTAVRGNGVTIDTTGSFLASNTTATLSGVFTNHSTNARLVDSAVDFADGLHVAGTLSLVNSYLKGAGTKTIASGGRLEGNGTVVGAMTVGGTIAPGFSQGSITFSNDLALSGTAEMELLSGGNLGTSDKINVLGALTGSGVVKVLTNGVFTIAGGDKWDLFDFAGTPSLTFDGSAITLDPGLSWDTSQLNIDGTIAVVPEPSALVLCGGGLALALIVLRRRRRAVRD